MKSVLFFGFLLGCAAGCERGDIEDVGEAALADCRPLRVDFVPAGTAPAAGWTADTGAAFDGTRGWVREDDRTTPLGLEPNARDRRRAGIDPRIDTFIHMQYGAASASSVSTPGAWLMKVPNGRYTVTVGVGDEAPYDSLHTIHVEGVRLVEGFRGSAVEEYRQGTADVTVADGTLTVDAAGGTNTKIAYLEARPAGCGAPVPPLPAPAGPADLVPWGGADATRWRPESVLANAHSRALDDAWAMADAVDAVSASPVKMQDGDYQEFGDGQAEAVPSFGVASRTRPQVVGTRVRFKDGTTKLVLRIDLGFSAAASIDVQWVSAGTRHGATLPTTTNDGGFGATWDVPRGASDLFFVRPVGAADWSPLWFGVPVRSAVELASTIPPAEQHFADGHGIFDHEDVGLSHPGVATDVLARLLGRTFSLPYSHSDLHDVHGLYKTPDGRTIVKAVGHGWDWAPRVAPFVVRYLCFEGRDAARESAAADGAVPSGAGWHEIVGKPAETLVNDLDSGPVPVGSAISIDPRDLPSGGFAAGLSDVAAMRWLLPGEAFVSPRSGTITRDDGTLGERRIYHRVYAGAATPRCIEVWVHPCTPANALDFTCATSRVDFAVDHVRSGSAYVLGNLPELGAWDARRAVPLTRGADDVWRASVTLPESALVESKFVTKDGTGAVTYESGANRAWQVPATPATSFAGTFR